MSHVEAGPWRIAGSPTEHEVAAVVAALTAAASAAGGTGGSDVPTAAAASGWSAYWRGLRTALPAGPGAWTASGQPRP